jgi:hypothetical protein
MLDPMKSTKMHAASTCLIGVILLGVGGRQAFFCVPAIAAIPPDISNVGGPTHQIEARLGCEIALFLMSTAKTPGPRDIFANPERHSLEADEQVNEQVITCFYL